MRKLSAPDQQQATPRWQALDLITTSEAREAVEYALMEAGALGTETDYVQPLLRVTAYFYTLHERVRFRA